MLTNQAHLFQLDPNVAYLNGAYMSPQLKSVEEAGISGLKKKSQPWTISEDDFFNARMVLKQRFSYLLDIDDSRQVSIIPSVSYGIANVAKNIPLREGQEILVVDEQFPSNIYTWQAVAKEKGAHINIVKPEKSGSGRGKSWNQNILNAINKNTAVVAIAHVHWADGTKYDLINIREKCNQVGAKLVLDGTQSIGALPFSVKEIKPDALVCGGYKWLMGPYSMGLAYYAPSFNEGQPIEDNWFNRYKSEDFRNLTNYQDQYQEGAERYSVGESSNFIMIPMLITAIDQLIEWKADRIQSYCQSISEDAILNLVNKGCQIEDEAFRAHHLFGIYLPEHINIDKVKSRLQENNVWVSYRGQAIRVSPNVYNTKEQMDLLASLIY